MEAKMEFAVETNQKAEKCLELFKGHFLNISDKYKFVLMMEPSEDFRGFGEWFYDHLHCDDIVPLSQFRDGAINGRITNFIYHRGMGMVFCNLIPGTHMRALASMYILEMLNKGIIPGRPWGDLPYWMGGDAHLAQDGFLFDAMGCFQSSCGEDIYRHRNMYYNAQEKMAFRNLPEYVYEWNDKNGR
jgi:hypothetical protein